MINKCLFIGRLGNDPEVRQNQNGDPISNISVAVSESWKDKSGERKQKTEWIKCVLFGHAAKFCRDYAKKGALVYVEGKLQTRKWTDNQGVDKYTTEIVVDGFSGEFKILDKKEDAKEDAFDKAAKMIDEHNSKKGNGFVPEKLSDDIPF